MEIKIIHKPTFSDNILLVPVFKENLKKFPVNYDKTIINFIKNRVKKDHFSAKKGEMFTTYVERGAVSQKLAIVGLGKQDKYSVKAALDLGGKIGKHLKLGKQKEVNIIILKEMENFVVELFEGIKMALYNFEHYKSKKEHRGEIKKINFVTAHDDKVLKEKLNKADVICEAVDYVKDLVNKPSSEVHADYFDKEARRIAKDNGCKLTILGLKELTKQGWGGVLAVAQGASQEPKVIILEHNGGSKNEKPEIIVGKGIVFDSGGYNLKPINHIEEMHQDMAGAAVVMGLFTVLKKLNIKRNIIGVVLATENMINEKAYRPSDIVKTLSGLTVEITNTDAEGRIILADGLTYATKRNPKFIISIATLTGAVAMALGDRFAAVMSHDKDLQNAIQRAGKDTDDLVWQLPLHADFQKKMKSPIADLRNKDSGTAHLAGSSKGAEFLHNFVAKNKWVHIDIGGTAFTSDPKEYESKGATAHGLRLLIRFFEKYA